MKAQTNVLQPISNLKEIRPDVRGFVKDDFKTAITEGSGVFRIKTDVFELSKVISDLRIIVKGSNQKKVVQSIDHSRKLWKECLRKSKGDYDKAIRLYEKS